MNSLQLNKMEEPDPPKARYIPLPLNVQQINSAKIAIANNHPLSRIPIDKVLPYLKYFTCCLRKQKKDFRVSLRKSLLKKMDLKMSKTDQKLEEDPYLRLGFGMGAYFDTLKYMMVLMLVLFLFSMPSAYIYNSYGHLKDQSMYFFTRFSLGNMGGAETICTTAPINSNYLPLRCKTGAMKTEFVKFGIIPQSGEDKNLCMDDESTQKCVSLLQQSKIFDVINQRCENQTDCFLDVDQLKKSFMKANGDEDCLLNSDFFVQVPCIVEEEDKISRQVQGLFIGCMGVFIALFFVIFIDYLRSIFKNAYIEWDVKTITAGDYSVELDISAKMWRTFLTQVYNPNIGKPKLVQFRNYLQNEMEERLTALPDLGFEEEAPDRIRIAMLTFAFDNSDMINLLHQRGLAIKYEKWERVREINQLIDDLKSINVDKYNRPVTAFLTFENEEGLNRCKNYNEAVFADDQYSHFRTLLTEKVNIKDASEPTDIIWENRHFTAWDRFQRTLVVIGCVFLLLAASFILVFICSRIATRPLLKYPSINCQDVIKSQGDAFAYHAFLEWDRNFDMTGKIEDDDPDYMGLLKCFCEQEKRDKPNFKKTDLYSGKRTKSGKVESFPICQTYISDTWNGKILGYFMSGMIVSINFVLRLILITLVKWIGEDTHSKQLKSITNTVFIVQFLNTGVLLLLVQANFKDVGLSLVNSVFKGPFYDFVPLWYVGVGQKIIQTMIFNAVWPFFEFMMYWPKLWLYRKMDRGWFSSDTYKTKKTNMQTYIDIYSGPDYLIHFKYSTIMNITFVTMMYGIGMPILYPIALVSFFILYTYERIVVAYFYQLPPSFDDKLTKNALGIVRWAGVFYLIFGFWQLSNQQIFQNFWAYISDTTERMLSGHYISEIAVDQAAPLLLMGTAVGTIIFMQTFFKKSLKTWGFTFGGVNLNVDENLPFFFNGLKLTDADWLLQEYNNLHDNYGFDIIGKDVAKTLDLVGTPKKSITGVPYYIILANPRYAKDFQYVSCDVPDREALINDDDSDDENDCEQSDLVVILLNMAYIPEEVVENFRFEAGFNKRFKPFMQEYKRKWKAILIEEARREEEEAELRVSLKSNRSSARKSPRKYSGDVEESSPLMKKMKRSVLKRDDDENDF